MDAESYDIFSSAMQFLHRYHLLISALYGVFFTAQLFAWWLQFPEDNFSWSVIFIPLYVVMLATFFLILIFAREVYNGIKHKSAIRRGWKFVTYICILAVGWALLTLFIILIVVDLDIPGVINKDVIFFPLTIYILVISIIAAVLFCFSYFTPNYNAVFGLNKWKNVV